MIPHNPKIEPYRVRKPYPSYPESTEKDGNNGVFRFRGPVGLDLLCIVSDGGGWDHISVEEEPARGMKQRCPTWEEMCFIKDLFFDPDEMVLQYHPAGRDYVNVHPYVLHLWRPQHVWFPKPPKIFV